jgi:hypothetical protein
MKKLEYLNLSSTQITGGGVFHLQELPRLERLALDANRIDDSCLPALLRIPSLKSLSIRGTDISDAGIARLRDQFPGLELFHGDWP